MMAKSFLFFSCCCCKSHGNSLVVCAGHLLNGLVADLERRTQVAFETNNNNFHVESIQGIHRLLLQIQKLERPFVNQQPKLEVSARLKLLQDWLEHQSVQIDGLRLEGGFAQGAGVMATKEFKKGEMMLVVPATAMMTSATAICSKVCNPNLFWF
jgi:hypothetical protein